MLFTECANLAERHPNLTSAVQKIDAQLRKMRTAEVIRVGDLASFLGLDPNKVTAVLEGLAEFGFLSAEQMVECAHCGMAVLRSHYDDVMDEEDEYRCTSCDRLWKDGRVQTVITYRRGDKWPEPQPVSARIVGNENILSEEKCKPALTQGHCRVIAHDGCKELSKKQYVGLVSGRNAYDIFIDGFTREVSHKGKARPKLSPAEFAMICEYIESKMAMRTLSTKTGEGRSREAANKLFEKARNKVDTRVSRYKYFACRTHKATEPVMKSFQFDPPENMTYCLIIPILR